MNHEFNGYECDVSVEQQDGHFHIVIQPRAFTAYRKEFNFVPGMTRAEVSAHKQTMIREVFKGVAGERIEAQLRSQLDNAKARISELESSLESEKEQFKQFRLGIGDAVAVQETEMAASGKPAAEPKPKAR